MSREFLIPKKVITGKGALESAMSDIVKTGKKPLIVSGPNVSKLDGFKTLVSALEKMNFPYAVFSGITGEPTDVMVDSALSEYRKNNCDFLIGIGGGSPLDTVKAVAVKTVYDKPLRKFLGIEVTGDFPPVIAIPTTAGTGSEATKFTVITDSETDVKMLLKGADLIPDLAVVDYEYTKTSPKNITVSTGLDALTHAVEAYTSKLAQPLTDALAISAVKRIFKYLPLAYRNGDDEKAREEMSAAALEAGICINNSSVTVVHGMSRPIGALFHVPHGLSNAMLLEKCMKFAYDGAPERFAGLAFAAGVAEKGDAPLCAAEKFVFALGALCKECNVPTILEYVIDAAEFEKAIPKMTADALASGSPQNTRKNVSKDDAEKIYKSLIM